MTKQFTAAQDKAFFDQVLGLTTARALAAILYMLISQRLDRDAVLKRIQSS